MTAASRRASRCSAMWAWNYRWGGRLCLSLNSVPAFGELEEGVYSAVCQNGLGSVKGTLAGMMAVELAAKGNSPMVADLLAYDAPKRLPPDMLMQVGANARPALEGNEGRAGTVTALSPQKKHRSP